jgi:hypothetical protein
MKQSYEKIQYMDMLNYIEDVIDDGVAAEEVLRNFEEQRRDSELDTIPDGTEKERLLYLKLWAKSQQISNDLGNLGEDYEVLDAIEHPETGEEIELERTELYENSVIKYSENTAINIRSGKQIPAVKPVDTKKIGAEKFFRAYNNQHPQKPSYTDSDRVQARWKYPVMYLDGADIDSVLNKTDSVTKAEALSQIRKNVTEEEAETLLSNTISDLTDEDVAEILNLDEKVRKGGEPEEMAKDIRMRAESIDRLESETNPMLAYSTIGIGGSWHYSTQPCGKACGGCPHGPYLYESYRDSSGQPHCDYKGRTL